MLLCTQVADERAVAVAQRLGFTELDRFTEFNARQWLVGWGYGTSEAPGPSTTPPKNNVRMPRRGKDHLPRRSAGSTQDVPTGWGHHQIYLRINTDCAAIERLLNA